VQILCTRGDVSSFLDVFPSNRLPQSVARNATTVIVNADRHTQRGSPCLAVHFRPKSSSAYYFDSYRILRLVPSIQAFIKSNCRAWDYKRRQLHGLTTDVRVKYCCLFALHLKGGYTPQQFISQFNACNHADRHVVRVFTAEFGAQMPRGCWGQFCLSCLQINYCARFYLFLIYHGWRQGGSD